MLGDTLLLERSKSCVAGSHVAHVRYARIDRGLRLRRAGLGMLLVGTLGGIIGRAAPECRIDGCDRADARALDALTGVMAGSAVGLLVGVAWPVRERWIELDGERPIRVGSINLRPAIRLSLDDRRR